METKNIYRVPIDLHSVTKIDRDSIAHVGEMEHAIDFDAPEGTPVLAAADGRVLSIKNNSNIGGDEPRFESDGNYIEILHANDEVSEYEHLKFQSVRVQPGDRVEIGQIIAEVGNTGWSECPHLHFMVFPKDQEYKTIEIQFNRSLTKI